MPTNSEPRLNKYVYFLIIAAGFVLLRLDAYGQVFKDDIIRLIDPDSYYHLRRILYTIGNYPHTLSFDNFLSYPHGDYVPWPPLFDFISATLLKPFGNNLVLMPALNLMYFSICFTALFFCIYRKSGIESAVISCIFISCAGILRVYTSYGRIDHHALELTLITGIYISFIAYFNSKKLFQLLIFTLLVFCSFLNWPGAPIYFPPLIFFVLTSLYRGKMDWDILKGLFIAFHIAAILIAIFLKITSTPDYPPYSYKFLSGFQRDFCFFVSVIFITLYFSHGKKVNPKYLWPATLILLALLFHKFFAEILSGFEFVDKQDKLIVLVEEASPLFFSSFYSLREEIGRFFFFFTPAIVLFPLFVYLYTKNAGSLLITCFTSFFLILTFFQLRFGYFFMLGYSVILGETLGRYIKRKYLPFAAGLFIALSVFTYYKDSKTSIDRFPAEEIYQTMRFLRDKTPETQSFEKGIALYGVFGSWDLGHYIIEAGKRPAVAHNFIGHALHNGETEYINALFSKSEDDVLKIMDRNKARFLVLQDPRDSLITDWSIISSGENPYIGKDGNVSDNALELFLFRLYKFDGTTPIENSPQHFRLIFYSDQKKVKVFERVAGVRIIVADKKGYTLKAKITGPSHSFSYVSSGKLTASGKEFIFPYSMNAPYNVGAQEVYLESGNYRYRLNIDEEDILTGRIIN
jgi:asparagine N-glycosylation enzyme membrane subunit Stt3